MGGLDIGASGAGGRKALDSQINMIPLIDLLMVTLSFLLITAVWTQMARVNADAAVPGPASPNSSSPPEPEPQLHVLMPSAERFVLAWKQGATTIDSIDVPRSAGSLGEPAGGLRFAELAARIETEWRGKGRHTRPSDGAFDQAVVHAPDTARFGEIVGVIDAISATRRSVVAGGKVASASAFHVVFAVN